MRHLLYLPLLFLFLTGCSKSEKSSSNLFRNIYKNTFWEIDGVIFTFSTDALFSNVNQTSCASWKEGTFNNVNYDGCTYNTVSYVIVSESESKFSFIEIVSSGKTDTGSNCNGSETTLTFQIINENLMNVNIAYKGGITESFTAKKVNTTYNLNNCTTDPSKTGLFG